MDLESLKKEIAQFCEERDWGQFHSPKNLAIALSVEASELLEIFQWLTLEQSEKLDADLKQKAEDEVGDVLICLLNLCQKLSIDPMQAAHAKLAKVKLKYPVDKARGLAKKYTELP